MRAVPPGLFALVGSALDTGAAPSKRQATGQAVRADRTWANLYDLRNHLAHS